MANSRMLLQSVNAPRAIVSTDSPIIRSLKFTQWLNARFSIVLTELPIITLLKFSHLLNE